MPNEVKLTHLTNSIIVLEGTKGSGMALASIHMVYKMHEAIRKEIQYLLEYQAELRLVGNDLSKQAKARLQKLQKMEVMPAKSTTE